jgi:N-acetyl-alpha-D-muramate 1-phosphate uridylyltransferase
VPAEVGPAAPGTPAEVGPAAPGGPAAPSAPAEVAAPTAASAAGAGGIVAVVLAAGEGRRLRPLTEQLPKALCPVGNVPLLDLALDRLARLGLAGPGAVAVNAWYLADQVVAALGDRGHPSWERGAHPLGTAGGIGNLRDWIAGRGVLAVNADGYLRGADGYLRGAAGAGGSAGGGADIAPLLAGWDGRHTRLLGVPAEPGRPAEFGAYRFAGVSLLPWWRVARLTGEPADLTRQVWRPAEAAGELVVIEYPGTYLDTGTPADYLAANLHAAAAAPGGVLIGDAATVTGTVSSAVIGAGAVVRGGVTRAVVWPGGTVPAGEQLSDAIRYGASGTVRAGRPPPWPARSAPGPTASMS